MRMNVKRKLWTAFLVLWVLLTIETSINELSNQGTLSFSSIIKLSLQIVGAIGIYGLIGNRKIFTQNFWRIFFNLQLGIVSTMILVVILYPAENFTPKISLSYIWFVSLYGLYFYGLFLYSYMSQKLWIATKLQK